MAVPPEQVVGDLDPGKVLATPWGHLRSQGYLRGLPTQRLGTTADKYQQLLVSAEIKRDFTAKLFHAYTTFATIGGEGGAKFADYAFKAFEDLKQATFPFDKTPPASESKNKSDMDIATKMFDTFTKRQQEAIAKHRSKGKSDKPLTGQEKSL